AFFGIVAERVLRGRARFAESGGMAAGFARPRLAGRRAWAATATCATVVTVAFLAPRRTRSDGEQAPRRRDQR
ncbi:MAG TPA: hypothetical protein P5340_11210, partial [Defluviicoccus sp.]|nr:hypothetical protein [Defluviicoccus sp.]